MSKVLELLAMGVIGFVLGFSLSLAYGFSAAERSGKPESSGELVASSYLNENHAYIVFQKEGTESFSVVHDPDCMECRASRLVFPSPRNEEPRGLGSTPE